MAPLDEAALSKLVDEKVAGCQVMVFSKTTCPFGARVENFFKTQGVAYEVMYLDQMETGPAIQGILLQKTGQRTVPNVFVGGKHLGKNSNLIFLAMVHLSLFLKYFLPGR